MNSDEDAKRPDDDEFGQVAKGPRVFFMVDVLPFFRWIKNKITKIEVIKHDDNR